MENDKKQYIESLNPHFTKRQLKEYYLMQFHFLTNNGKTDQIDFLTFYNYINFPFPVAQKIFNTFSSNQRNINQTEFIKGLNTLTFSSFNHKVIFLINLFDFTKLQIIHYENIILLIKHLHINSSNKSLDDIIEHFRELFDSYMNINEDHPFTYDQMDKIIKKCPDIFYYFYMNFNLRKPFEDINIHFHQRHVKKVSGKNSNKRLFLGKNGPSLHKKGDLNGNNTHGDDDENKYDDDDRKDDDNVQSPYLPSDFLYSYFNSIQVNSSSSSTMDTGDESELNDLVDFENDICQVKDKINRNMRIRPLMKCKEHLSLKERSYNFNNGTMILEGSFETSKLNGLNSNSNKRVCSKNSVSCFKFDSSSFNHNKNLTDISEPMNGYYYNNTATTNSQLYTKVIVYIIKEDLYVFNVEGNNDDEGELLAFISLKHLFIEGSKNNDENSNNTIASIQLFGKEINAYKVNLKTYISCKSQQFTFAFIKIDESNLFKQIIKDITNYSNVNDYYKEIEIINQGSFGIVYKVEEKDTQRIFAKKVLIKQQDSDYITLLLYKQEEYIFGLFANMSHPGIAQCHEIYEDESALYIIQEYYPDGSLSDLYRNYSSNNTLTTSMIESILQQLLSSLQFLYKFGIVHRDLKLENILMSQLQTKIIDFGLSIIIGKDETKKEICGSLGYLAPELLKRNGYNHSVDVWAMGVIGYYLLYGKFHYGNHAKKNDLDFLINWIIETPYTFPEYGKIKGPTSHLLKLKNFVIKCLEKDIELRTNIMDLRI